MSVNNLYITAAVKRHEKRGEKLQIVRKKLSHVRISPNSELLIPNAAAPAGYKQSQHNMSRGDGGKNESSKYRQWPLQTPSMINVKGFLFLICQSFQGSLTYAYFQPQCSHHSSRWSGTSQTYYYPPLLRLVLSKLQISPFATFHNAP